MTREEQVALVREVEPDLSIQNLVLGIYERLDRAAKIRLLVRMKDEDLDAFLWAEAEGRR